MIKNLNISTKSINIKDLISFTRTFYDNPKMIILEKLLQIKGFVVADLKINFEYRVKGSSKLNYKILIYLLQFIIFRIFQKTYRFFKIFT